MFNVNENKKLLFVLRNSARLKLTEKKRKKLFMLFYRGECYNVSTEMERKQ